MKRIFVAFVVVLCVSPLVLAQTPSMTAHFIDIGRGESVLLEFPGGAMLIDAGAHKALRSFAMFYERNVVFLPIYGDAALYSRLRDYPAGNVLLSAQGTPPWPMRPLFLNDNAA